MKKIPSPWYEITWIVVWTAALAWFLGSGRFNLREMIGLTLVWMILVGITAYFLVKRWKYLPKRKAPEERAVARTPARNAPCPCGSGLKFKRCCGEK